MGEFAKDVQSIFIEDELRQSYLDYSMSVIVSRALPDVRDGLKPVHRRILHAMRELNNGWDKPYKKSARVVGDVIGKYHPHGDAAVYTSIVRMAQSFAMRYTLIEGQGNFGSIDGDAPAAMRYTEVRMRRITQELLADIDKETVNFVPNYDNTETIPDVLPARIPNLLINGSSGIAVGMATNIPPHNIKEVIAAAKALLKNPNIDLPKLMKCLPGPDFPTGGIIKGRTGIVEAYSTGRGRVIMRARVKIEDMKGGREVIVISELPYQVNKAHLVERIAELVRDKKITGISELRDESDKDGIRVVMELRRNELTQRVLDNLYKHTAMQSTFSINMVALSKNRPRLMGLKTILEEFLAHRREIITKRTLFLLRKARSRAHILEGLFVATDNIDKVVQTIRSSSTAEDARVALINVQWLPSPNLSKLLATKDRAIFTPADLSDEYGAQIQGKELHYRLSPEQVKGILELRLQRLTGLEQEKIREEYQQLGDTINNYMTILSGKNQLEAILASELDELSEEFSDERRSELSDDIVELNIEDLIPNNECVVTLTHGGYITSQELETYKAQKRGGVGSTGTSVKEDDVMSQIMVVQAHNTLLCFSNWARVYWLRVYDIPLVSRTARGRPLVNLLHLGEGEHINAVLPIKNYSDSRQIMMVTETGFVKRIELSVFSKPKSKGVRALVLNVGDRLVAAQLVTHDNDIMMLSQRGKCTRFSAKAVRIVGRTARGVIGMRLSEKDRVVAAIVPKEDAMICTVSRLGYGKRSPNSDFASKGRGGQGVIAQQTNKRNGVLIGAVQAVPGDEFMLISNQGTVLRIKAGDISIQSRATLGVRLMRLREGEEFVSIARIAQQVDAPLADTPTEE